VFLLSGKNKSYEPTSVTFWSVSICCIAFVSVMMPAYEWMVACIDNYTQPVAVRVCTVSAAIDFHRLRPVTVLPSFLMFNSHLIFLFFAEYICVFVSLCATKFDLHFCWYSFYRVTLLFSKKKKRLLTILMWIIRVVKNMWLAMYQRSVTFTSFQ
jgi:hypothetical protein